MEKESEDLAYNLFIDQKRTNTQMRQLDCVIYVMILRCKAVPWK